MTYAVVTCDVTCDVMLQAGGDRQDLHEKIRVHSMAAGMAVKGEGKQNDLMDRVAKDPAFEAVHGDRLASLIDPALFIGRSPEQAREQHACTCVNVYHTAVNLNCVRVMCLWGGGGGAGWWLRMHGVVLCLFVGGIVDARMLFWCVCVRSHVIRRGAGNLLCGAGNLLTFRFKLFFFVFALVCVLHRSSIFQYGLCLVSVRVRKSGATCAWLFYSATSSKVLVFYAGQTQPNSWGLLVRVFCTKHHHCCCCCFLSPLPNTGGRVPCGVCGPYPREARGTAAREEHRRRQRLVYLQSSKHSRREREREQHTKLKLASND